MTAFDKALDERLVRNKNLAVPWFLQASYLYYIRNESLLSDQRYDLLCVQLMEWWNEINHYHKHLIDKEQLGAGTGYTIKEEDYPTITIVAACHNMGIPEPNWDELFARKSFLRIKGS